MRMDIITDTSSAVVAAGGILATVIGFYFWVRYKIRKHDDALRNHETRLCAVEAGAHSAGRKIDIVHRNLVKLMEAQQIEPVRDLFENER